VALADGVTSYVTVSDLPGAMAAKLTGVAVVVVCVPDVSVG
jgi:hypothetical protein